MRAAEFTRRRAERRHPRPTQWGYLHLQRLLADLETVLGRLEGPLEVLDIFCGTRPYEDLLPPGSSCVGLDVHNGYGVADVVTREFLPFPDNSFDLVICIQAFYHVRDPAYAVSEIRRVLRPGGTVVVTVPGVWEYDKTAIEHRWTGPLLASLFDGFQDVEVCENGGYSVCWATLTCRILNLIQMSAPRRFGFQAVIKPWFALAYVIVNAAGAMLDRVEHRFRIGSYMLAINLLVTAKSPNSV